jgi:anti-anti-sigma factor
MSKFEHLDVSERDDAILVRVKEPLLDDAAAFAVGNELDELGEQPRCRTVVMDFSGVEHVSSLMLGLLVTLREQTASRGGILVLCGLSPEVRELFDSTMPGQPWDIRERAVDAFAVFA